MKQTIVLSVKPDHGSATLTGHYLKDGVVFNITKDPWDVVAGELPPSKRRFNYSFNFKENNTRFVIEWDSDDKEVNKYMEKVRLFYAKHPHVEGIGYKNDNLVLDMFTMQILEDVEKENYRLNKLYINVINLVDAMSISQKRDLIFFFGGNPTKMDDCQVWLDLIGFSGGRLLNENNANIFLKSIREEQQEEVFMRTMIKKAISYGIIQTINNKFYSKQNDLLGIDEDSVYIYYKEQTELFDFIKREVGSKEGVKSELSQKSNKTKEPTLTAK